MYAVSLGKEGTAGWWCTYCKPMKPDWQINGNERGDSWTINDIVLHSEGIDYFSQARDRMVVNTTPVIKSIPVSHYITPILHITIGKGNNILEHLINDMQVVDESYTDEYVASQIDIETMSILLRTSKELITNFLLYHQGYIKDL